MTTNNMNVVKTPKGWNWVCLKRLGISSALFLLLIFYIGITGCKTTSNGIPGNSLVSEEKTSNMILIADNLPKEGMIITGFSGEAFYNAIPHRGDISCQGGAPALEKLMPPWCEPGSKTIVRNRELTGTLNSKDPRTSGNVSVIMDMDLDSTSYTGKIWGTFLWYIPGKGTWEGTYTGEYNGQTSAAYRYTGHGTGDFQGMHIEVYAIWVAVKGEMLSGHIIEPGRVR